MAETMKNTGAPNNIELQLREKRKKEEEGTVRQQQRLLGTLGILIPLVIYLLGVIFHTSGSRWDPLGSISAYYYTAAVSAFSGMLVVLAFFFLTYKGFNNTAHIFDWFFSKLASLAAVLVALFPTTTPDGFQRLPWWQDWMAKIHFGAAATLFVTFSVFSLFLFPKSDVKDKQDQKKYKKWRNNIYRFCGAAILLCLAYAAYAAKKGWPIFAPETAALLFFSISFLTKGHIHEFFGTALRYLLAPRMLMQKIWKDIQGDQEAQPPEPPEPTEPAATYGDI